MQKLILLAFITHTDNKIFAHKIWHDESGYGQSLDKSANPVFR